MDIELFIGIFGIATSIIAISGIIYGFGFKFSRLETRVNLIWSVFVEDALRNQVRAGTLSHSSPYHRTQSGYELGELVPAKVFSKLSNKSFRSDQELTTALIRELGLDTIIEESDKLNITVQEFLAISICTIKGD